jgi:hypothetical protein
MKYLKKFENFSDQDLGRFSMEDEMDNKRMKFEEEEGDESTCPDCNCKECECNPNYDEFSDDEEEGDEEKNWNDDSQLVEKKKINAGFQAYLDKQKAKKAGKKKKKVVKNLNLIS